MINPFLKYFRQPLQRAGGTQAKISAKFGRMGCACQLLSLKGLAEIFQKWVYHIKLCSYFDNPLKNLLVKFVHPIVQLGGYVSSASLNCTFFRILANCAFYACYTPHLNDDLDFK